MRVFRHFGEEQTTVGEVVTSAGAVRAVALRTAEGEEVDAPSDDAVIAKQDSVVMLVRTRQADGEAGASRQVESMAWSDEMLVGNALIE